MKQKHPYFSILFFGMAVFAATTEISTADESDAIRPKLTLGAYYYPWYRARGDERRDGEGIGWMRQALRGRLVPRQLPRLGVYDSRDPEVIAAHINQSRAANIDLWALSWWGPDSLTDRIIREAILEHPDADQLRYAALYESTGRLGSFEKPDYANLLSDFEFLQKHYFDHTRYLKIDGKPVVFFYLTRVYFRNRGAKELAALRERFPDLYLIGDDVFGPNYTREMAEPWDAVTAYDVYGQSLQLDGATQAAIDRLRKNYTEAKEAANAVGSAFVPAISPGYNDRAVRDGHRGFGRAFSDREGSEEGDIFRAMIRDIAYPLADPDAERLVMITSFNEWYEDTQIEPTAGIEPPTSKDNSRSGQAYAEGNTYVDYGDLYLEILRDESAGKASP